MTYKIPSEDEIKKIVLKILRYRGVIESQAELLNQVKKHLVRRGENFKISGKRLRKIAIKMPEVDVEIRCRTTDKEVENMEICPVCGEKMERITNLTLEGEKIVVGFRCTYCSYWTGNKLRVPMRYIFHLKGSSDPPYSF